MRYIFVDESWDDYLYWQKTDFINDLKEKTALIINFELKSLV